MKTRVLISLILLSSGWLVSGLAARTPEALARKDLKISLQDKKISALSPSGLTLSFFSQIENSSEKKYSLVSYQYQVLVNQKEYFRQQISLDQPIDILPDKATSINFPVKINYQYLNPLLTEAQKQASCQVLGEMFFQDEKKKTERVVFYFQMDFPIFKFPEIDFLPLSVKDLTLGGADFSFRFQLKNDNPYDLLIQRIQLELNLEGRTIFKGEVPGDKTLSAGQAKNFSIPLMLDFFELGRDLRESLQEESTLFTLKAWFEADSAWGLLTFSIEKQGSVKKEFSR
ncbi:MAG: LEA type 2 family protein [Candidatus Aminicenantes bacterium]|nr:LEA type 2 family protein [Candidatus Aminicenantes bacterium]